MTLGQFVKRNVVGILSVAAVTALVLLMIVFLRACGPTAGSATKAGSKTAAETIEQTPTYESPYDWTKLDRTDGRFSYVVDGQVISRLGVDVSENQHAVDWQAVKADGIDFAMIRLGYRGATEGDLYLDATYYDNLAGAKAAGLDCGVYFFSQAITVEEAVQEADYVIQNLGGTALEYPVAFDSEVIASLGVDRTANLSNDEMTAIAEAFCERVEQAGYACFVYGNRGDLSRYNSELLDRYRIWWAEYDAPVPAAQIDIALWQYSNGGSVAGIETAVDLNIDLSAVLNSDS